MSEEIQKSPTDPRRIKLAGVLILIGAIGSSFSLLLTNPNLKISHILIFYVIYFSFLIIMVLGIILLYVSKKTQS